MAGVITTARIRAAISDLILARVGLGFAGVSIPFTGCLTWVFFLTFVGPAAVKRLRTRRFRSRAAALVVPRSANAIAEAMLSSHLVAVGGGAVEVNNGEIKVAACGRWSEDSVAELGSISKALTGLALASMVNEGIISLDAPLGSLLDLKGPLAGRTVGELARHRSGLPRLGPLARVFGTVLTGTSQPYRAWTSANVVKIADGSRLDVGSPTYSNLGFAVLGVVLERAADAPLADILRERVFDPAGMTNASLIDEGARAEPGHDALGFVVPSWIHSGAAGAVQASLRDMGSLGAALTQPRGELGQAFTLACLPGDESPSQGLGWAVRTFDDERPPLYWHNGGTAGYSTCFGVQGTKAWFAAVDRGNVGSADLAMGELIRTTQR